MTGINLSGGHSGTLSKAIEKIGKDSLSGVLEVTATGSVTRVHFKNGSAVFAEQVAGNNVWPLGDYLVESGIIRSRKLLKIIDKAKAKNLAPEDLLLQKKLVGESVLKRFSELQLKELIYPLFRLADPMVQWSEERPQAARLITPLPAAFVVKEGNRRRAAWEELFDAVGRETAVYEKDPHDLALLLGYEKADRDFGTGISVPARIAFFHTNGKRTVAQVARTSGLGLFETYQAFHDLLIEDLLVLVSPNGPGERKSTLRPYLHMLAALLSYAIFALLIVLGANWAIQNQAEITANVIASETAKGNEETGAELVRLKRNLQAYELTFGKFPDRLSALPEAGFATGFSIEQLNALDYKKEKGHYLLKVTAPKTKR